MAPQGEVGKPWWWLQLCNSANNNHHQNNNNNNNDNDNQSFKYIAPRKDTKWQTFVARVAFIATLTTMGCAFFLIRRRRRSLLLSSVSAGPSIEQLEAEDTLEQQLVETPTPNAIG